MTLADPRTRKDWLLQQAAEIRQQMQQEGWRISPAAEDQIHVSSAVGWVEHLVTYHRAALDTDGLPYQTSAFSLCPLFRPDTRCACGQLTVSWVEAP